MRFEEFKFIADENINPLVIKFVQAQNISVATVFDLNLNGNPDEFILAKSFEYKQGNITHDADFGKIIFSAQTNFVGIIYLRPGHFEAQHSIASLEKLINSKLDFHPPFIAVVENKSGNIVIRLRNDIYN